MPADKTHVVRKNFRLTEKEAACLAKHAAKSGVTESDYVRVLIQDPAHVFITEASALRDIYRELKRQGTNLNQIAYAVNSGRASTIDIDALAQINNRNRKALGMLAEALDGKEVRHANS